MIECGTYYDMWRGKQRERGTAVPTGKPPDLTFDTLFPQVRALGPGPSRTHIPKFQDQKAVGVAGAAGLHPGFPDTHLGRSRLHIGLGTGNISTNRRSDSVLLGGK